MNPLLLQTSPAPVSAPEPAPPAEPRGPLVSVVVKALNEEKNIEATLSSVMDAIRGLDAEVILADSGSSDRTVELARRFPVRIVQLADPAEASCGIGPQLGFQHARGDYIYLIDGDMQLCPDFLPHALSFLQRHTEIAGIGGRVIEVNTEGLEYLRRSEQTAHFKPGPTDRLDCGGLYRRRAIDSVGYFSNRNLHSYEEFELGMRLRLAGWTLWRMADDAILHRGHEAPPYELLLRRWKSRYICGLGELLRAHLHDDRRRRQLLKIRELRLYGAVLLSWLALAVVALLPLALAGKAVLIAGLLLLPVVVLAWRKGSWQRGLYAVVSWHINAAGLLRGMLAPQRDPKAPIASVILQDEDRLEEVSPAGSTSEPALQRSNPLELELDGQPGHQSVTTLTPLAATSKRPPLNSQLA